jgi:single-strand DNA-binding protein
MLLVSLIGNLGADPEVRYTAEGKEVVSIRVAVNQSKRGRDGEREESTNWFRVTFWPGNYMVDVVKDRCTKGTRVMIVGRLEIGSYQGRDDGATHVTYDVRPHELQVISKDRGDNGGGHDDDDRSERRPAGGGGGGGRQERHEAAGDLEDLPFHHPRWLDEPWLERLP